MPSIESNEYEEARLRQTEDQGVNKATLTNANSMDALAIITESDSIAKLKGDGARLSYDSNTGQDNTARAIWAAYALVAFSDRVGDCDEELQTVVSDLLADLRHLCDAVGVDYNAADETAISNYQDEVEGRY